MHILFVTLEYPTQAHPVNAVFVQEHARAAAEFHQVSLLHILGIDPTLKQPYRLEQEQDGERLNVYRLHYRRPWLPKTGLLAQASATLAAVQQIAARSGPPEVIHANLYSSALMAYLLRLRWRIPAILTEHSSAYPRKLFKPGQLEIARWAMNRLNLLLPVSRNLAGHIRQAGVRTPSEIVPNVVDCGLFYPPSAAPEPAPDGIPQAIIVANPNPVKAIHLLLQAIAGLAQRGRPLRLRLVGEGPERPRLQALAQELGISHLLRFEGYQPKPQIAALLRQADLFILSSLWENYPVALLEALACGLPVVVPAVGGIPEVFDLPGAPICGRLFSPGDAAALQAQLAALLDELPSYDRPQIAAFASRHFSRAAVAAQFDQIYHRLRKPDV